MGLFLILRIFSSLNFNLGPLSSLTISGDDSGDGDNEGVSDDEEEHDEDESPEDDDDMEDVDEVDMGDGGELYEDDQLVIEDASWSELLSNFLLLDEMPEHDVPSVVISLL